MVDAPVAQRTPQARTQSSGIPTPSKSYGSLPSALNSPSLSLGPNPRRPPGHDRSTGSISSFSNSTSSAPGVSSSSSHNNAVKSPGTPFRTLRNLLPFGPGKPPQQQQGAVSSPVPSRNLFSTFASSKKSSVLGDPKRRASGVGERPQGSQRERRASGSHLRVVDPSPVISIDASNGVYAIPSSHTVHASSSSNLGVELEPPTRVGSAPPRIQSPVIGLDDFTQSLGVSLYARSSASVSTARSSLDERPLPALPIPVQPHFSDEPAGDLSTIMEADTSGMSRHIPADSSLASVAQELSFSPGDHNHESTPLDSHHSGTPFLLPSSLPVEKPPSDVHSHHTVSSFLDIDEASIDEYDAVGNESVVISDNDMDDADGVSFNLEALDPDLAALLSPHRIPRSINSDQADAVDAVLSSIQPPSLSPSPEVPIVTLPAPGSPLRAEGSSQSTVGASPASATNSSRTVGSQSSPRRRSLNMSQSGSHARREPVAEPSSSASPPTHIRRPSTTISTIPRLVRPAAGQMTPLKPTSSNVPPSQSVSPVLPRRQPSSPLAGTGPSKYQPRADARSASEQTPAARRPPPQSRLTTPARHASLYTPARPSLRTLKTSSTETWENDSVSPSSRASSSLGPASRLQHYPRSNLNGESASDFGGYVDERTRKRSMSVDERGFSPGPAYRTTAYGQTLRPSTSMSHTNPPAETSRPSAEWLGPRTAKAFAAAGLLDFDRASGQNQQPPPESTARIGAIRSNSERDYRSMQAPSRTAFSEASGSASWGGTVPNAQGAFPWAGAGSSVSSWGRSRGVGMSASMSEAGRSPFVDSPPSTSRSPNFSTARTTYSNGSTAPTSEYGGPSSAMQLMKDKHDVATEALLSALSDSQRTTKVLREENTELRERLAMMEGRMREMEHQLEDAVRELQWRASQAMPPPPPLHRMVLEHRSRAGSVESNSQRLPPPVMQSLPQRNSFESQIASSSRLEQEESTDFLPTPTPNSETFIKGHRKKFSATSSIFPIPPSNMTLLMQEGGDERLGDLIPPFSSSSDSRSFSTMDASRSFGGGGDGMSPTHSVASSPDSPTVSFPKQHSRGESGRWNVTSTSSSPTTTSFSMTTGSPGSLYLRPEHELHLGDMVSLDLGRRPDDMDSNDGSEDDAF